jgi:hypothetical protein
MAIDIDGFKILSAIAARPDVYTAVRIEAGKAARALVVKQLKDKGLTVALLSEISSSIGEMSFHMILEQLSDAETKSLLTKVDKHNADMKVGSPDARRKHIVRLATKAVNPSHAPAKAIKEKKTPKEPKTAKPVIRAGADGKALRARRKSAP